MQYLDKDYILNTLTTEDVIKICNLLGSPNYKLDNQGNPCFSTSICHGGDSPYKLIYYHTPGPEYENRKHGTFHCFSGETKIITREGIKYIKDLCNTECEILNGNGEWERVIINHYGKQPLMKITATCNSKKKIIYATPEHEWIINGYWYKKQTQELKPNMYLEKVLPKKRNDIIIDPEGIKHGFCYGDGYIVYKNLSGYYYYSCHFCTETKLQLKKYFQDGHFRVDNLNGIEYLNVNFLSQTNMKQIPDINCSEGYLLGFLAGYFAADGNSCGARTSIYSHKKEDLEKIKDICVKCGIATYPIAEYDIKKGNRGCVTVNKETKAWNLRIVRNTLPDCFFVTDKGKNNNSAYNGRLRYKIISVTETDRYEDVYCCQTSTHSFALEDYILTGNCYTCGDTYDIVELVIRAFRQQGKTYTWYKALRWIAQVTGKLKVAASDKQIETIHIEDFSWIDRLKTAQKKKRAVPNLSEINENILEIFCYYPHEEWLKDHITCEALGRFGIGYYGLTNQIIIPHYDINERLIGIRGRYLDKMDIDLIGKYVPLQIEGKFLSHQLGSNLYGIHVCKDAIKAKRKIMLVEAEKSVLQSYSYFGENSFTVATCGSAITLTQIKIILEQLQVSEVLYAPDRDYHEADSFEAEAWWQKQLKKVAPLVPYVKVCIVADKEERLDFKDSPTDRGKKILLELLDEKIPITMDDIKALEKDR